MGNTILLLGKSMVEKVNARQEKITFKLFGGYFFNWGRRFLIGDGENFKNLKWGTVILIHGLIVK